MGNISPDISDLVIRPGRAADRDALATIDSYAADHPSRVAEIAGWLADADVLVAERAGKIVGYAAVNQAFLGQPYLAILMVAAGDRRCGTGSALLAVCRRKRPRLWTSTNESNLAMQRLLAASGFQQAGCIEGLDPGDPELFYLWDQTSASR